MWLITGLLSATPVWAADQIHWTIIDQTSVTFDWRGIEDTLYYGLTPSYGQSVVAATPDPEPTSSSGPFWEARITGLQENARYYYRIGSGPGHTFRTPPPRGSSDFVVYTIGDVGSSNSRWRVTDVQALIAAGNPDFCLITGDLTYGDDRGMDEVDQHFNDVMAWSRDAAYMPAWGNHDFSSPDDHENYTGRFDLPNPQASPGSPSSAGEDWYWFDYGNVRFIGYPEPWSGARAEWATQAMALMDEAQVDPDITYIVTFGHRTSYSSGHHSGSGSLRDYLDALGASHSKYVLSLNSHSHNYERTYPQSGVVHITAGIGGANLEQESGSCLWAEGCPPPSWSAFRAMHHGAVKLRFTPTGIAITAICGPPGDAGNENDITCSPGDVFDSTAIGNPSPPPLRAPTVLAPASASGLLGTTISVGVTASDLDGDPIGSLTADLGALPAGHGATFTTSPGNTSGLFEWTPTPGHEGGPYPVVFTAANALSGSDTTLVDVNQAPIAHLALTPPGGYGPMTVQIDASGSFDPDGSIATYDFDFGDGASSGPQPNAATLHAFAIGTWNVTVTITDDQDATAVTSQMLTVIEGGGETLGPELVTNPSFEQSTDGWKDYGSASIDRVSGGWDGDWALEISGSGSGQYGINDSPTVVSEALEAGTQYRFEAWVRADQNTDGVRIRVREYDGGSEEAQVYTDPLALSPVWQSVVLDYANLVTGSFLDFQVLVTPDAGPDDFLIDGISIRTVEPGAPVASVPARSGERLTAFVSPNPARSGFTLGFDLPRAGRVSVGVFDASGRRVHATRQTMSAGRHDMAIARRDANDVPLPAGIYFFRVQSGPDAAHGRFVLLD